MTDAIRTAIEAGDVEGLRALVAADASLAVADVTWGEDKKIVLPPLHLVCDAVFRGLLTQERALALTNVLLGSGVDPEQAYAKSGDTYLIAAASLGAESVGLRLVEAGADVTKRGLFGATALHWAAYCGLEHLTRALVKAGGALELVDERYDCTPLQWVLHGWTTGSGGGRDGLARAARALVELGARVPASELERLGKDTDAPLREALSGGPSR
jgi:hypothetical protein